MIRYSRRRAVAAALVVLALSACSHAAPARTPTVPKVTTVVANSGSVLPKQTLAGIVAPYQNVAVQSTLSEPADEVYVQEGDRVKAGQVIARLDVADLQAQLNADLATAAANHAATSHNVYQGSLTIAQGQDSVRTAQAAVQQAQATLQKDQLDLTRYNSLGKAGYIAAQTISSQETLVRNDQQALRSAQAALAGAQSAVQANGTMSTNGLQATTVQQSQANEQVAIAQADQVRVQIGKATIVSPIDGVIVNRNLNPGEYPGTRQIFTIQQVDPIYAILRGSGAQIAQIQTGARATVTSSDLRDRKYSGAVVGVLNQIVPGSTDFQVKVQLPNPAEHLRPGMAVVGVIALPALRGIMVPVTAFTDDSHSSVMTVGPDGTAQTVRVVETGEGGKVAVVRGLEAGARVIADGQSGVGDGEKVAIR